MKKGHLTGMAKEVGTESFDIWWARNHPRDWWREARRGKPLPDRDRLRVWQLVKAAYEKSENPGG